MDERIYTRAVSATGLASYEAVEKWLNGLLKIKNLDADDIHFTVTGIRQFPVSPSYHVGVPNVNERTVFDAVAIIEATARFGRTSTAGRRKVE